MKILSATGFAFGVTRLTGVRYLSGVCFFERGDVMKLAGMEAAVYLRKSRAEDGLTTEDTLARHQATLAEYAARHEIHSAGFAAMSCTSTA